MQADTDMMKLNKERDNQIKYLNDENKKKLEDKLFTIMNLPTFIDNKTNENQKINDAKKIQKLELEKDNKVLIDNLKQEYQKYLDTARQQVLFNYLKKYKEKYFFFFSFLFFSFCTALLLCQLVFLNLK